MDELVEIGYVARAHGVRGELRVRTHDPESTTLEHAEEVVIGGARYRVDRARQVSGAFLLVLHGVGDRDAAEALKGQAVSVDRRYIALEEGEVLLADLVGLAVLLPDGSSWGRVARIDVGHQDRLVIHDGDLERLLPIVPELIVDIDLERGHITVDPPEGLPTAPIR